MAPAVPPIPANRRDVRKRSEANCGYSNDVGPHERVFR
jgi:hypothetical protein